MRGRSLGESEAHEAGRLLGLTRTADVVDAVVVTTALRQKAMILTGDRDDMERLVVRASGREVAVVTVWLSAFYGQVTDRHCEPA